MKPLLRPLLRWTRWALIAAAVALLAYFGFVFSDAWTFQRAEGRQLESLVAAPASPAGLSPAPVGLIGRVDVPRLGISAIVMEGTTSRVLRRAVGHIIGTSLPGEAGNVAISGHRDTFFRPLRNIEPSDIILLTTAAGEYRYRVLSTTIVAPDDVAVLEPGDGETLTLVTCYPFYFKCRPRSEEVHRSGRTG